MISQQIVQQTELRRLLLRYGREGGQRPAPQPTRGRTSHAPDTDQFVERLGGDVSLVPGLVETVLPGGERQSLRSVSQNDMDAGDVELL